MSQSLWLSIDDHMGVQVVSQQEFKDCHPPLRDTIVFERAGDAYTSQEKTKGSNFRDFPWFGFSAASLHMMLCTIVIARKGLVSPRILSLLLGCWIHVLMFRRPILAILSHVFPEGRQCKQDALFELSREARNELWAISLLGQVCITDLRLDVAPFIYCTDASLQRGRICVVEETQSVVAELWRHSEQRGYSTQLLNPAASVLAELGLEHVDPLPEISDPQVIDNVVRVPVSLREGYVFDTLELFRGEGNWTLAHKELGMHVHGGVDVRGHQVAFEDMLDDSVFHELLSLALRHAVRDWHTLSALRTAFLMHIVTSWVIMSVLSNLAHLSCFILMSSNV